MLISLKSTAAPALSTSLTAEDIRRYGIRTLAEAIDFLAIAAASSDNLNKVDAIFIAPKSGPIAFDTMEAYARGDDVPLKVFNTDRVFDSSNAEDYLPEAF